MYVEQWFKALQSIIRYRFQSPDVICKAAPLTTTIQEIVVKLEAGIEAEDHIVSSLLLLGPPRIGKTLCVEEAFQRLSPTSKSKSICIRISPWLHNDEISCHRSIVQQLAQALSCESSISASKNDHTLHTAELKELLQDCAKFEKTVILVLDRLEAFCQQSRQSFLYHIFDLQHHTGFKLLILGLSTVNDIYDWLEKRVRSRISMETLHVQGITEYPHLHDVVKSFLTIDQDEFQIKIQKQPTKHRNSRAAEKWMHILHEFYHDAVNQFLLSYDIQKQWTHHLLHGKEIRWFLDVACSGILFPKQAVLDQLFDSHWMDSIRRSQSHISSQGSSDHDSKSSSSLKDFVDPTYLKSLQPSYGDDAMGSILSENNDNPLSVLFSTAKAPLESRRYHQIIASELNIVECTVLGAITRLHMNNILPKTFARILSQIGAFEKSHSEQFRLRRCASSYYRAFCRLIDRRIIELSTSSFSKKQRARAYTADYWGHHVPCKFPEHKVFSQNLEHYKIPTFLQNWILGEGTYHD